MKLWTGRLSGDMDGWAEILNNSLPYDQRMCLEDVEGSMAWAAALYQSGLLSEIEHNSIQQGLQTIFLMFEAGNFPFQQTDEDIHSAVERQLTELIGDIGGKLHTGRSRNDQVATDFKLWTIKATKSVMAWLRDAQSALLIRAETDMGHIIPGYTHLQQAQPILLSHWWLSHFWALQRDFSHFQNLLAELDVMPLGSGALAGTGFPIDRHALAESLHFSQACPNSLDGVHDRDFAAGFLFNASLLGIHLSQMAETLILFSTQEFNRISLSDDFSTGSSIMPQKKNPDTLELIRGKSGFLLGKLMGFMSTLKSLPSAYDKDLQEDKIAVFEVFDTLEIILKVTAGILKTLTVKSDSSNERIHPYMMATDLADELVLRGMPFRQAHHVVAAAVKFAEAQKMSITQIPMSVWQSFSPLIGKWVYEIFDARQSINRRSTWGGTAPEAVNAQLAHARQVIQQQ